METPHLNILLDAALDAKQALLDSLGIASCLIEEQGDRFTIIAMNPHFREFYSLKSNTQQLDITVESLHKASGTPVNLLEPVVLRMQANASHCFKTGELIHTENQMPQPDGSEKWSRNCISPIIRGCEVVSILVSVVDITETIQVQNTTEENLTRLISQHARVCNGCTRIHSGNGEWLLLENFMETRTDLKFSHGLCSSCKQELL